MEAKDKIDTWVIGSDISARAVDTAKSNIELCGFDKAYMQSVLDAPTRPVIQNPLILQYHWPSHEAQSLKIGSGEESMERSLIPINASDLDTFLSLYQGSYDAIGAYLGEMTNNFEDF